MSAEDFFDNDKAKNSSIPADDEPTDNQTTGDSRTPDDQLSMKPESWVSIFGLTFLLGFLAVAVILKMVQACMPTKNQSSSSKNTKEKGQPNKSSAQAKKAKELCKQFKVWNYPGPPSFTETISIPSSTDTPSIGSLSDGKESRGSPKSAEQTAEAAIAKSQEKNEKKKAQPSAEAAKPTDKQESPAAVCKTPQTSEADKTLSGKMKKQQ
ncbi:hypothetical protein TTRE_0000328101 [Trichuris trichiura]|uniref:Uncharacterized protein n=1 Tax=Trichuris trichiura TaxID=36087 RepID=A0A077Z8J4_TRITR|nr:hypothetical protein TTRE_0000328101 [Trichuris trichiura]